MRVIIKRLMWSLGRLLRCLKGGITITFFLKGKKIKSRERLGDVDSKVKFFSEYLFLKIKGQCHSLF